MNVKYVRSKNLRFFQLTKAYNQNELKDNFIISVFFIQDLFGCLLARVGGVGRHYPFARNSIWFTSAQSLEGPRPSRGHIAGRIMFTLVLSAPYSGSLRRRKGQAQWQSELKYKTDLHECFLEVKIPMYYYRQTG